MTMASRLLDLLYPPRCVFCGKLLQKGMRDFCTPCRLRLPICHQQWDLGPELRGTAVALQYTGIVRTALLRFKFHDRPVYAHSFAPLLAAAASTLPMDSIDSITWIPVSRRRKRQRGYDQTFLLARDIASILNRPLESVLQKTRDNRPQSTLRSAEARQSNVTGVYRLRKGAACAGKHYLLLDDILTTGSTAREAARTLLSAGASAVYFAALATGRDP